MQDFRKRGLLALGLASLVCFVVSHACLCDWASHVRLDLFLHGFFDYQLKDLREANVPIETDLMSMAVFRHALCIGYVSREGYFLALGDDPIVFGERSLIVTAALWYMRLISFMALVLVAGRVLVKGGVRRS